MRYSKALAALLPVSIHAAIPLSKQHPLIARVDQPYSWSLSPLTFEDADTSSISLHAAPGWLTYDNGTSTFRGRPSAEDIGVTTVHVRNSLGTEDQFLLWVTDLPSPTVHIPLASQLVPGNPSISSGFTFPAPGVGVRVPPKWSFSIGFDGYTFTTPDRRKIFYEATLDNSLPLPDWVTFNNRTLTFDGVAPPENHPAALSVLLHGSDRWGFGAIHQRFDLVVGPRTHLLGTDGTGGLETVNVTGGVPFVHSIQTFGGLVIDGVQAVSANVSRVEVNVSSIPWVTFNSTMRVLAGVPPVSAIGQPPYILPVSITSDYNDTVTTNLSIVAFPSYFSTTRISSMDVIPGSFLTFSIQQYFSHARSAPAAVTPQIVPHAASSWLAFNGANNSLSGFVPQSTTYNEVNITFYATDLETHAVSAVSMLLSIASKEPFGPKVWDHPHGANHSARAKTAIIVTFTILGGAVLLCCLLAICRRYCGAGEREEDECSNQRKGRILTPSHAPRSPPSDMIQSTGVNRMDLANDRSLEDGCNSSKTPGQADSAVGVVEKTMKKLQFCWGLLTLPKLQKSWNQAAGLQPGDIRRSQISRPTPISDDGTLAQMSIMQVGGGSPSSAAKPSGKLVAGRIGVTGSISSVARSKPGPTLRGSEAFPFKNSAQMAPDRSSQAPSVLDGSSLTSIPRRRSDFLPPQHQHVAMPDHISGDTISSVAISSSSGSENSDHGDCAVITFAARQMVPSSISTPPVSQATFPAPPESGTFAVPNKHQSLPGSPGNTSIPEIRRPRLVQVNSEHRTPRLPAGQAVVIGRSRESDCGEADLDQRLSLGIHYVSGLGGTEDSESAVFYLTPSVENATLPMIGKLSPDQRGPSRAPLTADGVLDNNKPRQAGGRNPTRIQIGTPFALSIRFEIIPTRDADLLVRQQDGQPAPRWINLDQRDVELWGVPRREHRGMHMLEIVESSKSGQRVVARIDLEVVGWE